MPLRSTTGNAVRLTRAEWTRIKQRAERIGINADTIDDIQTEEDLQKALDTERQCLLLDVIFGLNEDPSDREAYRRGEITDEDILGMSREDIERAIREKAAKEVSDN